MRNDYGDRLLSVEEGLTLTLGELSLPGARYVYELEGVELNGQKPKIELMSFIHAADDSVRRYTVKYIQGEGDKPIAAMAQAIRSFATREIPVSYQTFTCEAEGFSIEVDSTYSVAYEQEKGVRIYTEASGSVPYATVWCLATDNLSSYNMDAMLSSHVQDMRATYGEQLRVAEETTITVSGETLNHWSRWIGKNTEQITVTWRR